jgi:hypothetical protein
MLTEDTPAGDQHAVVSRRPWQRRGWVIAGVAFIALIGSGGTYGYVAYASAKPVNEALDHARMSFTEVLDSWSDARTVDDVRVSADLAAEVRGEIADRAETVGDGRSGEKVDAVTSALLAESSVAAAGGALSVLTSDDLSAWGELQPALADAVVAYDLSVDELRTVDSDAAQMQPDAAAAFHHLESVMAAAVAADALADTARVLDGLSTAATTREVRGVVTDAVQVQASLTVVADAFDTAAVEGERIAALIAILDGVAQLAPLSGDELEAWTTARPDVVQALAEVPAGDAAVARLSVQGNGAVVAIDHLVSSAERRLHKWRTNKASILAAQQADRAALSTYAEQMRSQMSHYSDLRGETSDFIDHIQSGAYVTYDEVYTFLGEAESDRRFARDDMSRLTVPSAVATQHSSIVMVVDRAISAIQAAHDGTFDAEWCAYCYWGDTPGWQTFTSESAAISTEYSTAIDAWEAAVTSAGDEIDRRQLPPMPRV